MRDTSNVSEPDTLSSTKDRLQDLRKAHSRELEDIYDAHAHDYHREALDRYLAKDDTQYLVKGENNPALVGSYTKLDVSSLCTNDSEI
jgi:predicted outer membrane protein